MTHSRLRRGLLATLGCAGVGLSAAAPLPWPDRPLRVVVPFPAGGTLDVIGRLLAQRLSERLKQTVVVENRPGASGNIGMEAIARAEPDGYSWLLASTVAAVNPTLTRMRFDPQRELAPVVRIGRMQVLLYGRKDLPANSIDEVLALIRSRPGMVSCGTAGGITRLAAEQLQQRAGAALLIVQYKGTTPALNDVASGQVDLAIGLAGSAAGLLGAGRLKLLSDADAGPAGAAKARTLADYDLAGWYAWFGPAGVPAPIVERMNLELNQILDEPATRDGLRELEVTPTGGSSGQLAELLRADTLRFRAIAQAAGLKPE